LYGIDCAGELDKHAVTRNLEHATAIAGNQRLQDAFPAGFQGSEGSSFVLLHKAAVTDDIGGHNGGKTALGAFFGHAIPWRREGPDCMSTTEVCLGWIRFGGSNACK
jgi:hypothetical protein